MAVLKKDIIIFAYQRFSSQIERDKHDSQYYHNLMADFRTTPAKKMEKTQKNGKIEQKTHKNREKRQKKQFLSKMTLCRLCLFFSFF